MISYSYSELPVFLDKNVKSGKDWFHEYVFTIQPQLKLTFGQILWLFHLTIMSPSITRSEFSHCLQAPQSRLWLPCSINMTWWLTSKFWGTRCSFPKLPLIIQPAYKCLPTRSSAFSSAPSFSDETKTGVHISSKKTLWCN